LAFFFSASVLTNYRHLDKQFLAEIIVKSGPRDIEQAIANVGVAGGLTLVYYFYPHPEVMAAFLGALAAPTADTWASELGTISRQTPRLITTFRPVTAGTSGGVTVTGTLAGVCGSLFIAFVGSILLLAGDADSSFFRLFLAGSLGGVAGLMSDSLLGATIQASYRDNANGQLTERPADRQGRPNTLVKGIRWFDNEWVNASCCLVGAGLAALSFVVL